VAGGCGYGDGLKSGQEEMEETEESLTLGCDAFSGRKGMYRKQLSSVTTRRNMKHVHYPASGFLIGHLPPSQLLGNSIYLSVSQTTHFRDISVLYEGGPKSNRNRPVAYACFLVTSCAAS
jgi:hypothetical protein